MNQLKLTLVTQTIPEIKPLNLVLSLPEVSRVANKCAQCVQLRMVINSQDGNELQLENVFADLGIQVFGLVSQIKSAKTFGWCFFTLIQNPLCFVSLV